MEPLSIIAISAAVGGVAGKFVEKAWAVGEKWLSPYFKDHYPKAQETARQNSLDFLADLAQRVHQLEENVKDSHRMRQQTEFSLEDPDFSVLLQEALIASSRTNNEDKHKILARIVSERLRCQSEGLVALTSTLACNAVKHLTPKQMKFLGITTFVQGIRPSPFPPAIPPQQFGQWYVNWLTRTLSLLLPTGSMTNLDFVHLESVSCVKYESFIVRDLKAVLSPPSETGYDWPFDDFVQNNPIGKKLRELWENGMQQITLTTAGQLIGIYVHDEQTKTTTTMIGW